MHLAQDGHPRSVLIGNPGLNSNESSIRNFEDDVYKESVSKLQRHEK